MIGPLRISVVIPVLNEAGRISTGLHELESHDFHEIIVVDGGSRDATCSIVAEFPQVRLVNASRGRAAQMNAGANRATGDVLLFLHADVVLPQDAIMHIHATLAEPETVAGAFRTWTVPDRPGCAPWWSPLLHLADLRSRYSRLPYGDQAIFLRRDLFHEVGGFPEIPIMEDLELSRRLNRCGRIRIARSSVRVSGRRFLARPFFYATLVNLFPLLYRCGVPLRWLGRLYGAVR